MTQQSVTTRTWFELLALGVLWGVGFLTIKLALAEVGFVTLVAHRVFWAALLLWAYVLLRGYAVPRSWKVWFAFLVMGFLNNIIPFSLMAWGQLYIETGLTSVFNAATAIFGVIAAALFFADEKMTLRKIIGVLLGFFGVATAIGLEAFLQFDIRSLAQLAVVAGTVSYALAGVWARKNFAGLRPEVAAAGMLTGSSLIILPAAYLIEGAPNFALSATAIGSLAFTAFFATAAAYLLYYRIMAAAGVANTMLVTLIIPPVSIIAGAVVLNESLPLRVFVGLGLLALGLLILDGRLFKRAAPAISQAEPPKA